MTNLVNVWVKITTEVVWLKYGSYVTNKSTLTSGFTRDTKSGVFSSTRLPLFMVHHYVDYIQIDFIGYIQITNHYFFFIGITMNSVWEQPAVGATPQCFSFFCQNTVAALKRSRGCVVDIANQFQTQPYSVGRPCTTNVSILNIVRSTSYKDQSADRKCGRLTGREAWFTAPALRGSFEIKKAERTREGGRIESTAWETKTGSLKEFQSGRHSGWWVIYSTERLVGWKTLF